MARSDLIDAMKGEDGESESTRRETPEHKTRKQRAEERRKELDDPKVQADILNGKPGLRYTLVLPREVETEEVVGNKRVRETITENVMREIYIPVEFTLGDIMKRRVYDEIESYCLNVSAEVLRANPEMIGKNELLAQNPLYLESAMTTCREKLRVLISKIAYYISDDPSKGVERPTPDDIAVGLGDTEFYAIGLVLMSIVNKKKEERKKAMAAALESQQPSPD